MTEISDEMMRSRLAKTRAYTLAILHIGPHRNGSGGDEIIWEHGRRNFVLKAQGLLPIVCPVGDGTDVAGIGIFTASPDEVRVLLDGDPAIATGVLTYEVHPCRGFPGDALPA